MYREKLNVVKKNPIAALYPTTKVWIVVLYCICISILATIRVNGYALYLIPLFLIIPLLFVMSGIGKHFFTLFKAVLIIVGFIFVVQTLVLKSDVILFQLGIFKIYEAGLQKSLSLCFIILNVAGILLWLFQTTDIKEFTFALEKKGVSHKASFVFLSTIQMIEVLKKNAQTIMDAQRARGIETEGNLLVRGKAFFPMIVPLVVGSIINTEERVLTLECKGFDAQGPKTHLVEIQKSGNEVKALIIASTITVILLLGRIMLWIQ